MDGDDFRRSLASWLLTRRRRTLQSLNTIVVEVVEPFGPLPLSEQKIRKIPLVGISEDDVKEELQCSICYEDFILNGFVRKLPCSHLYHEGCILPWLKLHGTCPLCRAVLDEIIADDVSADNLNEGVDAIYRMMFEDMDIISDEMD